MGQNGGDFFFFYLVVPCNAFLQNNKVINRLKSLKLLDEGVYINRSPLCLSLPCVKFLMTPLSPHAAHVT